MAIRSQPITVDLSTLVDDEDNFVLKVHASIGAGGDYALKAGIPHSMARDIVAGLKLLHAVRAATGKDNF